jgi:hypothetical protein
VTPIRTIVLSAFFIGSLVFQTACSDASLAALSKGMVDVSAANAAIATTVISANANGTMTADEARPILQINLQVAQTGKAINATIRGLSALTPAQKGMILPQIQALAQGITQTVGTLNISNAGVKNAILVSLTAIQTALATVTVALGA